MSSHGNKKHSEAEVLTITYDVSNPDDIDDTEKVVETSSSNTTTTSTTLVLPPKPPRSAFMCYTDAMKAEQLAAAVIAGGGNDVQISEKKILNNVAAKWKSLTDRQRAEWEEVSRQDKVRFAREKAAYKGPWELPKRRARKHPLAPKRPMSAFLKYSQNRRQEVKEANPEMNNTDISRLLGELWRAADAAEKEPYVESEKVERAFYNEAIANWREEQAHLDAVSRTSHHSVRQQQQQHSVVDPRTTIDVPPPIKKKRREHIPQSISDTSSHSTAPTYTSSDGKIVDRRIFRSYSGSSHPHENKPYAYDPRNYHSSYYPSDSSRSHNTKGEPSSYYQHKPPLDTAAPYKSEPISTSGSNGTSTVQPLEYPTTRYHPNQYRPQYPTPHGENRHVVPLPNTGSDLFDNGFHDPEPPFNPRQTRPSSSHYNGYFFS